MPEEGSYIVQAWATPVYLQHAHQLRESEGEAWPSLQGIEAVNRALGEAVQTAYSAFWTELDAQTTAKALQWHSACTSSEESPAYRSGTNLNILPRVFKRWVTLRGGVDSILPSAEVSFVREAIRRAVDEMLRSLRIPEAFGPSGGPPSPGVDDVTLELFLSVHGNCSTSAETGGSSDFLRGSYIVQVPPGSGQFALTDPRGPMTPFIQDGFRFRVKRGMLVLYPGWLPSQMLPSTCSTPRIAIDFSVRLPTHPPRHHDGKPYDPFDPCWTIHSRRTANGTTCDRPYGIHLLRLHDLRTTDELPPLPRLRKRSPNTHSSLLDGEEGH